MRLPRQAGGLIPAGLPGTMASDTADLYDPQLSLSLIAQYKAEKGRHRTVCPSGQLGLPRPVRIHTVRMAAVGYPCQRRGDTDGKLAPGYGNRQNRFFPRELGGRLS